MRRRGPAAGFTLVELLVALAVTGVVVTAGHAALASLSDARRHAREVGRSALAAANARATLTRWLRSATILLEPASRSDGALPLDELSFAVPDAGSLHPGPHRIRLRIDRTPASGGRGLVAILTAARAGSARRETLTVVPEARGLDLRYRVEESGVHRWVERWDRARHFPDAVSLRLVGIPRIRLGEGAEGELPPLFTFPITVPIEARRW